MKIDDGCYDYSCDRCFDYYANKTWQKRPSRPSACTPRRIERHPRLVASQPWLNPAISSPEDAVIDTAPNRPNNQDSSDPPAPPPPRIVRNLNRDWSFCYDPEASSDIRRSQANQPPDDFHPVALPHTWHTYETTGQVHPFIRNPAETDSSYWWHGWGWYRKRIRIDSGHAHRRVFLEFDGVQKFCRVYCNEKLIGEHRGGFASFSVDITEAVRWNDENLIAVAVSARQEDEFGGIPPMTAGNWDLYGGIYRDVRLVLKNSVHLPFQGSADHEGGTFVTTPVVNHRQAQVRIITHVRNAGDTDTEITVHHRIIDPEGSLTAQFKTQQLISRQSIAAVTLDSPLLETPKLWSPETPRLYTVKTRILRNGTVVDCIDSPLGFRWFRWDDKENALYLNGERVRITGMNRHQEYPWLGDAVPKSFHEDDLRDMRENLGVNFARWCHYTQDKFVYDWCDRHGILVCEEVPNIKNLPFGAEVQRQQVIEMIRRDRNHPCIIMWSMGNETDNGADGRWARAEDAGRIIHYRKVSGPTPACDHSHLNLDMENLLRCTVRGWWEPEAMDPASAPLPADHENGQITGTEAWQHQAARIRDASTRGRIDDDTVIWIYADHGADREYRHCPLKHVNPKGWVDAYRQPKQIYWLWQANRTDRLMVHVRDYWWRPSQLGQRRDIVVDSNGETVELYSGDRLIDVQYPGADNFYSVVFRNVKVEKTDLRAVARRGQDTVTHPVPMSEGPAALRLRASHPAISADRTGIALISADVVDRRGVPVIGACPPLHWNLEGPATMLAPPDFISDLDQREQMDGTMYTVTPVVMPIRSLCQAGIITISVTSPGLSGNRLKIRSCLPAAPPEDGIMELKAAADDNRHRLRQQQHESSRQPAGEQRQTPLVYADIVVGSTDRNTIRRHLWETFSQCKFLHQADHNAVALIETLTDLTVAGNGILIADDANFHLQRFITRQQQK